MTYTDSFGNLWFRSLVVKQNSSNYGKILFETYSRESVAKSDKFLVKGISSDDKRMFSLFENYIKFYLYQNKVSPEYRCFFETILGEKSQKVYFDIDIENDEI